MFYRICVIQLYEFVSLVLVNFSLTIFLFSHCYYVKNSKLSFVTLDVAVAISKK